MTWQAGEAKAEQAVRPINILTEYSYFCIVLRVRESENSKLGRGTEHAREDAKHPSSGCRFRRIPARVAATRPKGEGQPSTHLENCTGKTFREKWKSRKIPVRSDGSGTHKSSGCHFISIVLGME